MFIKLSTIILLLPLLLFADYIGDKSCISCHEKEHKEWSSSDHDLAMQEANSQTVLGDFNGARFNYNGIITRFFKKGERFMVNTDGADGKLHDYEISFTIGVYPLQQYMVKFPKGKIQVLDIAWDSRAKQDGGQRWFHIHQDDNVTANDVLHWTGANFNWNYMCADCHSTNLKKNYDAATKKYNTTYAYINVSCEACHGEGSEHLKWVKNRQKYDNTLKKGLKDLGKKHNWKIDTKSHKPILIGEIDRTEVEMCAKCHSRRTQLGDDFKTAKSFHDNYRPVNLSEGLYEPDGKIKDEVYVYGSFVQSKMYTAGVTCSDCHNPHSLERYAVGDNVCNKCHIRSHYDKPQHTHHKRGSASCIECHMPSRIYMGVDERNDHSFRIPRPDLSDKFKMPNACNNCHKERSNSWSTKAMKKWYGDIPKGHQDFSYAIHSNTQNEKSALQDIYSVLMSSTPDIAKATLIPYLGDYPSRQTFTTSVQMLHSHDPMIRISALQSLGKFPLHHVKKELLKAFQDPIKSVRIEAARVMMHYDKTTLNAEEKHLYSKVLKEYKTSLDFLSDRAEAQTELANYYTMSGELNRAELAYKEALRLEKFYLPAYVNYANFLQLQGKENASLAIINRGLSNLKDANTLLEALGLWYARNNQQDKSVQVLKRAASLDKTDARLQYVYAVSIAEKDINEAIKILEASLKHHNGDTAILRALVYYYTTVGNKQMEDFYRQKLKDTFKIIKAPL